MLVIKKLEQNNNMVKKNQRKHSNLNSEKLKTKYQVLSEPSKATTMKATVLMTMRMTTMMAESRVNFNQAVLATKRKIMKRKKKRK